MRFYTNRALKIRSLLLGVGLIASLCSSGQGTWHTLNHLAPHYNAGVMLLLTDGTVMCKTSSGGSGQGTRWDKLTPDINGSYRNGTWTTLAAMNDDRLYFSSQVLKDGRVYVAGGEYGSGGSKSEVYDPLTDTWTMCPTLSGGEVISDANSEIMDDGTVMQAVVGSGSRHIYFYHPATNTYTTGPSSFGSSNESAWAKLPDNSILFVDISSTNSERYIPSTNSWVHDGTVPVSLYDPFGSEMGGAFLLPDGRAFYIGAYGSNALYTPSGSASPGTWATAPATPGAQGAPDAASAMMVNGKVLFAVSPVPTSADHFPPPTAFYEYDYVSNTITLVGAPSGGFSMANSCYITNMLDLPDGTVLFCNQGDDQYYQYVPSGSPLTSGKPTVANIFRVDCDTFMATGTLFNGISEGASYGDDWQMNSNYPIIRLKSGANVYYARTTNWNSTGVMRGSSPDTTTFVLPAGLPVGSYTLEVVANGIASDPFPVNTSIAISPSSSSFCAGLSNTLTDVWSGGVWSSANTAIATVNASSGVVTGVSAGTTTITYTIGACFATATVTINTSPGPITPPGAINICQGGTTTLGDGTFGGSWSSSNTAIATVGASTGIVSGVSTGSATISYLVSGCPALKDVTVNPLPGATITAVGTTTICSGGSVVLNANTGAGYTYQWFLGGSPISGATNFSLLASSAGNYTVTVSSPFGCNSTSVITTVTIGTSPTATITPAGPTVFCTGGSVVLNANTGVGLTYQWQLGASPIVGATASSYTASTGGSYTVIVTNSTGCSTTSSATTVTVNPGPGATITPAGPTTFCVPGSVVLNANTGPGITYQWQLGGVDIPGAVASSFTASATGGYAVIVSLGACVVTSPSVAVTALSASAGTITGPSAVCIGQTITLADATTGGSWSSSNPAIATINSSGVVTGLSAGVVVMSYTVSNMCGIATTTRSISVSVGTAVGPILGALTVCPGGTTVLSDVTPGGVWTSSNPAVATVGTSSGIVNAISIGVSNISYSVTSLSGCVTSSTAVFNVSSTFSAAISPAGATTFCTGGNVLLNATTGSGYTYQWKKNGANIAGAVSASYVANTTGLYTVLITAPGGCNTLTAPVSVTVTSGSIVVPSVGFSASPGTIFCLATSPATFIASSTNGGSAPIYQWYVNGAVVGSGGLYSYTPTAGDIVKCELTSNATCAFPTTVSHSETITVSAMQTPSVTITASSPIICHGESATFTAVPVFGGSSPSYNWTLNGVNVWGGAAYTYVPAEGDILICTMTSNYPCLVTSTAASIAYTVHVQSTIPNSINIYASNISIAPGASDTFVAVAPYGGTSPVYQWRINGAPVPGATNAMFITTSLMDSMVVSCEVTSSNPCVFPRTELSSGLVVRVWGVGVHEVSNSGSNFTLVPNPNKGEFTIDGILRGGADSKVNIVITDMLGQAVYSHTATARNGKLHEQLSLSKSIARGMYMVSITSGEDHVVYHMVLSE